jgi:hypothetical protein
MMGVWSRGSRKAFFVARFASGLCGRRSSEMVPRRGGRNRTSQIPRDLVYLPRVKAGLSSDALSRHTNIATSVCGYHPDECDRWRLWCGQPHYYRKHELTSRRDKPAAPGWGCPLLHLHCPRATRMYWHGRYIMSSLMIVLGATRSHRCADGRDHQA